MRRNHFFWSDRIRIRRERRALLVIFAAILLIYGWLGGDDYTEARRVECAQAGKTYSPKHDTCEAKPKQVAL